MKKLANISTIALFTFLALNTQVLANSASIENPVGFESLEEVINAYLPLLRIIVVMLFVGVMMYGGFVWLSAGASEDKVENAKKIIGAGVAGFIIIVLAPALVQFIGALLGVEGGLLNSF